jgi:hypothetical protein
MRALLLLTALAGCVTTAAGPLPAAEDVAALLLVRATCIPDPPELAHCGANPESVIVSGLRCRAAPGAGHASRLFCAFSHHERYRSGLARVGGLLECAHFVREGERWRILDFPDAEVCIDFASQP